MRAKRRQFRRRKALRFPFLFGGTFIEGEESGEWLKERGTFPFLFGGTFIEGYARDKPGKNIKWISLPFRRDFH